VISTPGGALAGGVLSEVLGRKATVQLTALPFLLGWIVMALSHDKISLCMGRFITGFATGKNNTVSYI
jgi:SP family facilitated glucose transporter-like MFS transporter 8